MIAPSQIPNPYVKPRWQAPVGVMESVVSYNCRKYGMPRPVLAMPMWEGAGNRAFDLSGHGNHGTLINAPSWTTNKETMALSFVFANDKYIQLDNKIYLLDDTKWTISFRVTPTVIANYRGIVSNDLTAGNYSRIFGDHAGRTYMYNDENQPILFGNSGFVVNEPKTLTFVCDGTNADNILMYVNGKNVETKTLADSTQTIYRLASLGSVTDYCYDGFFSYFNVYDNIELSAAQVKLLYENPYFMYRLPEELYGYSAAAAGISMPLLMQQMNQFDGGTYALC